jgi:hypothetical protein
MGMSTIVGRLVLCVGVVVLGSFGELRAACSWEGDYRCPNEGRGGRLDRWVGVGSRVLELASLAGAQWERQWQTPQASSESRVAAVPRAVPFQSHPGLETAPDAGGYRGGATVVVPDAAMAARMRELERENGDLREARRAAEETLVAAQSEAGALRWEQERLVARHEVQMIELNRRLQEADARLSEVMLSRAPEASMAESHYVERIEELERAREELTRTNVERVSLLEAKIVGLEREAEGLRVSLEEAERSGALAAGSGNAAAEAELKALRGTRDRELQGARLEVASLREGMAERDAELERLRALISEVPDAPEPAPERKEEESSESILITEAETPYATPAPGQPGIVYSPFEKDQFKLIDVTGLEPGSMAKDPHTGKVFRVP